MTDRAEIERLLNQTGRTLEGLPEEYPIETVDKIACMTDWEYSNRILQQSDVIELLVGALRDALTERDTAIRDIPRACGYCKNYNNPQKIEESEHGTLVTYCAKGCLHISGVNTGWEWRGVKKERQRRGKNA